MMEREILANYRINKETMALAMCREDIGVCIVYEQKKTLYVRRHAFDLIKQSCIKDGWAAYEGKRKAVQEIMSFQYKIPIPVIPKLNLHFFPTHGAMNDDNVWINPDMIRRCVDGQLPGMTLMTLANGEEVDVLLQKYSLQALYIRALMCQQRFNNTDPFECV